MPNINPGSFLTQELECKTTEIIMNVFMFVFCALNAKREAQNSKHTSSKSINYFHTTCMIYILALRKSCCMATENNAVVIHRHNQTIAMRINT